jgi:hypothetical protein
MIINLDSLPLNIYNKIPINIKTYKKEYELSELPKDIQQLISTYHKEETINYKETTYEFEPIISEFGDFNTISNLKELVLKYAMSYLYTMKGDYPFNGSVGSNIKKFIQKKDTTLQKLYLTEELSNMVTSFAESVDKSIKVQNFNVYKNSNTSIVEYNLELSLIVAGEPTNFRTSFIL